MFASLHILWQVKELGVIAQFLENVDGLERLRIFSAK